MRVRAAKGTGDAARARRCGEGDQLQDEAKSGDARDDSGAHGWMRERSDDMDEDRRERGRSRRLGKWPWPAGKGATELRSLPALSRTTYVVIL